MSADLTIPDYGVHLCRMVVDGHRIRIGFESKKGELPNFETVERILERIANGVTSWINNSFVSSYGFVFNEWMYADGILTQDIEDAIKSVCCSADRSRLDRFVEARKALKTSISKHFMNNVELFPLMLIKGSQEDHFVDFRLKQSPEVDQFIDFQCRDPEACQNAIILISKDSDYAIKYRTFERIRKEDPEVLIIVVAYTDDDGLCPALMDACDVYFLSDVDGEVRLAPKTMKRIQNLPPSWENNFRHK